MPYEQYGSLQKFVEVALPFIHHIHLHDHDGVKDHLLPKAGKINFKFLEFVACNDLPVILEVPIHNLDEGRSLLDFCEVYGL